MTELCDGQISGKNFIAGLSRIRPYHDRDLAMVTDWLIDTFDPDLASPEFDVDHPPWSIRRQLALFRRFLISEQPHQWPSDAFRGDIFPFARLMLAALVASASLLLSSLALSSLLLAIPAVCFWCVTIWLVRRERTANEKDFQRVQQRAATYGDPAWWPFLNADAFLKAGSVRSIMAQRHRRGL